eukprot:gene13011-17443_t
MDESNIEEPQSNQQNQDQGYLRSATAKWSNEETLYAKKLVQVFNDGYLQILPGTLCKHFLAEKLLCPLERITAKYRSFGKRTYAPNPNAVYEKFKQYELELNEYQDLFITKIKSCNGDEEDQDNDQDDDYTENSPNPVQEDSESTKKRKFIRSEDGEFVEEDEDTSKRIETSSGRVVKKPVRTTFFLGSDKKRNSSSEYYEDQVVEYGDKKRRYPKPNSTVKSESFTFNTVAHRIRWTPEMDRLLVEGYNLLSNKIVKRTGDGWDSIAKHVGFGVTDYQCRKRWTAYHDPILATYRKGPWSPDEEQKLKDLISAHRENNPDADTPWKEIVKILNRGTKDCIVKLQQIENAAMKKGPYSAEEDKIIINRVREWGDKGSGLWVSLSKELNRNLMLIRARYITLLKQYRRKQVNNSVPEFLKPGAHIDGSNSDNQDESEVISKSGNSEVNNHDHLIQLHQIHHQQQLQQFHTIQHYQQQQMQMYHPN